MRRNILILSFLLLNLYPMFAYPEGRVFEDQPQFEFFYEFTYLRNIVESFLLECTGERDVANKFAFATAPISNSYKNDILGLTGSVKRVPFWDMNIWDKGLLFSCDNLNYHN